MIKNQIDDTWVKDSHTASITIHSHFEKFAELTYFDRMGETENKTATTATAICNALVL